MLRHALLRGSPALPLSHGVAAPLRRSVPAARRATPARRLTTSASASPSERRALLASVVGAAGIALIGNELWKSSFAVQLPSAEAGSRRAKYNYVADAAEIAAPSVVHISSTRVTFFGAMRAGGSGFIIHPDGFVATNAHVVQLAETPAQHGRGGRLPPGARQAPSDFGGLIVTLSDGTECKGHVWAMDPMTDLALVKIERPSEEAGKPFPVANIGVSQGVRMGETVLALGSPFDLQNSVSAGVVSSAARHANELGLPHRAYDFIQTDASVNSGNSGGPLCDLDGKVIAINTMKAGSGGEGLSFAIPIDVAYPILEQLRVHRQVRRPFIGVRMIALDPTVAHQEQARGTVLPADVDVGVLVVNLAANGPAEKAGLRIGDVVVKANGRPCTGPSDLVRAVGFEIGKETTLTVKRALNKNPRNVSEIEIVVESTELPMEAAISALGSGPAAPN